MIDTIEVLWGAKEVGSRRVSMRPTSGGISPIHARERQTSSLPIELDVRELRARLVDGLGWEEKRFLYEDSAAGPVPKGAWKGGALTLMYQPGRLELRASLPKLLTGRNDVVLDERGVHDGIRELVRVGSEATGCELSLREMVPKRIDYAFQWTVPSVAFTLEHFRSALPIGRSPRTENLSPRFGGRTLMFGTGGKRAVRFYDKGAEAADRAYRERELEPIGLDRSELEGLDDALRQRVIARARERAVKEARGSGKALGYELDTILRYEVQDKRRQRLRLVHEQGYLASAVRDELRHVVQGIGNLVVHRLDELIGSYGNSPYAFAIVAATAHLAEHEEWWAVAGRHLSRRSVYRWRQRVREYALSVGDWRPTIPDDAFAASSSFWGTALEQVA